MIWCKLHHCPIIGTERCYEARLWTHGSEGRCILVPMPSGLRLTYQGRVYVG